MEPSHSKETFLANWNIFVAVIQLTPWHNLAVQEPQICVPYCITEYDCEDLENFSARCIRSFDKEAFRGGNCVLISRPSGLMAMQHCFVRLMVCEFRSDKRLTISISLKPFDTVSSLALVLLLEDQAGNLKRQILAPEASFKILASQAENVPHIRNLFMDPNIIVSRVHKPAIINDNDWETNDFEILTENTVIEIGVLHLGVCAVLLGKISIKADETTPETPT